MRKKRWHILLFGAAFLLLPAASLLCKFKETQLIFQPDQVPVASFSFCRTSSSATAVSLFLPDAYRVLNVENDQVMVLSPVEYITGVVAAEMPASFESEALKAQAVAAHSYALRQMGEQMEAPDEVLKGAFLSTDPAHFQAYLSPSQRKQRLKAEEEKKIVDAVTDVIHEILVYEDEPALAAFHAISNGKTESAQVIWGSKVPYLVAVDSAGDSTHPEATAQFSFSQEEVCSILATNCPSAELTGAFDQWIHIHSRSDSGTVLSVDIGGTAATGTDIRQWFGLSAANFSIAVRENKLIFTCLGRGHGVGMSQYGANDMAKNGSDFREILAHYYPGTQLQSVADHS